MHAESIDWTKALLIAGGSPAVRDQIVDGVLELFADQGELAPLFVITGRSNEVGRLRELSHRGIGLAKQGAMPTLERLCKELQACLAENRLEDAGALGVALREERENVHRVVVALRSQG
ncbi:hypothetical protein CKO31_25065 [Thiohalocapsa halophila]|uniref:Hpt domain-containing protein n=1 Tax=Thiohalocapsa halophila TaxID=69359 RepID=A0ABS1CQ70_9GAMM|nr:hypothetical protein [Thiohalocapsa halophila]MBK1633938.1 hypothetical protein [Thiohalocapsa halophila]